MENKLEVGMYVRTDNGIIGKIYEQIGDMFTYKDSNRDYITYGLSHNEILKASNNIIDLIEVGDIIKYHPMQNGYVKTNILYKAMKDGRDLTVLYYDIFHEKKKILSILTKEQFSSMEYRLGDE